MKICLAQIAAAKGEPAVNLEKMARVVREAASEGAELVCFPELFYSGYDITGERLRALAILRDGPEMGCIKALAADSKVHVLISYPERDAASEDVFISASLIDDTGAVLLNHRKTYRWGDEKEKVNAGAGYEVCDTRFGRMGVLICYEIEFPEPARILALQGAEIILVTSAFTFVENMPTYLSGIAIQNQCYVLSANDVRFEVPRRGSSCVVDQYGRVCARLDDKEGLLYYDLDLDGPSRRCTDPHFRDLDPATLQMLADMAGCH